ncbi:hypothetical protein [Croceitalea rosinachiae]|uniref:Ankyrin repeat domain-containing protein n=1 Tax=Croceitalea rosinachiae TaxID=3075596 RepID=A0ABU3A6N1_9FLAO|nr:hypothetical protein [Croceitalea sp. F388]MDT0605624.1 hypothetical protein [Croceitalea sp. F388]
MKRSLFLKTSGLSVFTMTILPQKALGFSKDLNDPEPLNNELVKEFVVAGHKTLPRVKELLEEYPNLIYCRYDWGNGDFEEAIEGAGHLGKKDIANYLISKGARVNLFVLTMLGKTELVRPILEAYPNLLNALGPHGFTLLHHAKVGKAKILEKYLLEQGLDKTHIPIK